MERFLEREQDHEGQSKSYCQPYVSHEKFEHFPSNGPKTKETRPNSLIDTRTSNKCYEWNNCIVITHFPYPQTRDAITTKDTCILHF